MRCDFCETRATVFLTQLVEGQMKKVCLCESCAKERGVTDPTGFSLADLLLGGSPPKPRRRRKSASNRRQCPECDFTIEDLRRVRRLGCAECYTAFADEVGQMVRGLHKGQSHSGKIPSGLAASHALHQRLEELRQQLEQAVAAESYEEAANIRDEIRNIESRKGARKP
jgi:protein arginine kinase activator